MVWHPECNGELFFMSDTVHATGLRDGLTPWILLGLGALLVALLLRAPASLLQKALPSSPALQVTAWGGTLWRGQMVWLQGDAQGLLSWQLTPWRLLTGRAQADIRSEGAAPLTGKVALGWNALEVRQLQGEVPATLVQGLLPPGWQLPGVLRAEGLEVARAGRKTGAWTAAGGQLLWGGGSVRFLLDGQVQQAVLPPLRIAPQLDGEILVLTMSEADSGQGLALLRLLPDGQVETQLRERLLRYNPAYRSSGGDPDAVVVTSRGVGNGLQ